MLYTIYISMLLYILHFLSAKHDKHLDNILKVAKDLCIVRLFLWTIFNSGFQLCSSIFCTPNLISFYLLVGDHISYASGRVSIKCWFVHLFLLSCTYINFNACLKLSFKFHGQSKKMPLIKRSDVKRKFLITETIILF